MSQDFSKPLDTPIDEEVEVDRMQFELSPDGKSATAKKVKEKVLVKTIYSRKNHYANICSEYNHDWIVPNPRKWVAVCTRCIKRVYLDPLSQTVRDGKIVNRETGQHIR
jgi:hypothetical protein